jgi:hypothetical protein
MVPPGQRDIEITPMVAHAPRVVPTGHAGDREKFAPSGSAVASASTAPSLAAAAAPAIFSDREIEPTIHVDQPAFEYGNGVGSETIRFRRPSDEPIQILPGRLEVVSGEPRHREIRFVRVPGEPAQLIVGREPGRSPQHVTLESHTVSRRHARFAFNNGRWAIENLSQTNPVVVNDEDLPDSAGERPLADGDKIELGEVVLRYRSQ